MSCFGRLFIKEDGDVEVDTYMLDYGTTAVKIIGGHAILENYELTWDSRYMYAD
jgi:hypothetical protein